MMVVSTVPESFSNAPCKNSQIAFSLVADFVLFLTHLAVVFGPQFDCIWHLYYSTFGPANWLLFTLFKYVLMIDPFHLNSSCCLLDSWMPVFDFEVMNWWYSCSNSCYVHGCQSSFFHGLYDDAISMLCLFQNQTHRV